MARKLKSDKLLFTATLLLVCTGVVMVYSASAVMAMERFQNPYLFLVKQVAWALIGLAALPVVMRVDYRNYRQPAVIWTALGIVGFALVAVLFAPRVNGATRWIGLGPLGIQPSELAKIAVILFMAALLERRMERIDEVGYSLLPIGVVLGGVVALVLAEPDLGHRGLHRDDRRDDDLRRRHRLSLRGRPDPGVGCRSATCWWRRPTTAGGASRHSSIHGPIRSATAGR